MARAHPPALWLRPIVEELRDRGLHRAARFLSLDSRRQEPIVRRFPMADMGLYGEAYRIHFQCLGARAAADAAAVLETGVRGHFVLAAHRRPRIKLANACREAREELLVLDEPAFGLALAPPAARVAVGET